MYPRRAWRVRLVERGHLVGNVRRRGELGQARTRHQHTEKRAGLVDVDPRFVSERFRGGVGEAIDEPALAEVVVDDEHAIGLSRLRTSRNDSTVNM